MRSPLLVTREDIVALEKDTGFVGIGERKIKAGKWKILEEECRKTVMGPSLTSPTKQHEKGTPLSGSQV